MTDVVESTVNDEAPVGARDEHYCSEDDHAQPDTRISTNLEEGAEILRDPENQEDCTEDHQR